MFTSLLVHNLRDHYFSPFNIPEVLEIKLSVCSKCQVGGFQAPIFNKCFKKSQLKSVGMVFLSEDLKRWNLQLYERKEKENSRRASGANRPKFTSMTDWELSLEMVLHPEEGRRIFFFFFGEDNASYVNSSPNKASKNQLNWIDKGTMILEKSWWSQMTKIQKVTDFTKKKWI